jgi:uncharacterized protein YabN with tetrapyrrole methylase and pyrophosphatase domain
MSPVRNSEPAKADIYVVGLGVMGVRDLTRAAEDAIRASKRVFHGAPDFGVAEYLEELCPAVESLLDLYTEGADRAEIYRAMAVRVLDGALDQPPVSFAVSGHPTVLVYPSRLICQAAKLLDLSVEVIPGVSSIDALLIDLGIDPGDRGLQIFEASGLLVEERRVDPEVPCLIFQAPAVESVFSTAAPSRPERFQRLHSHLAQFYPEDLEVVFAESSNFPLLPPRLERFKLSELTDRLASAAPMGTLYMPPVAEPVTRDQELERQLFDPLHVNRITYPLDS